MSKLYKLIESQIDQMLQVIMRDSQGNIQWGKYGISTPVYVQYVINLLTTLIFTIVLMTLGLYLWNEGLRKGMPSVFARIDSYYQLFITLFALMMIF